MISNVGIMEPEGILKGSNRKERSRNTTTITGNKPAVQSSHQGCMMSLVLASLVLSSTWVMPIFASSAWRLAAFSSSTTTAWWRCGKK